MKLIAIGVGGSGASCLECLVHMAALGILPDDVELIPVMVDPDQQHPRIQAASRFIAEYGVVRERGGASASGPFGARISRIVGTNALRPSDLDSLFPLLGLHQPIAESLARTFFSVVEMGDPDSREFANGYYGHVNAGVCFFNDPAGRAALIQALGMYLIAGDGAVVLIGSSFGGTGAAGLVHLARVFREDEGLKNVEFRIAAIQLEPFFKPDQPTGTTNGTAFVNLPDTFAGRTGAAYQFLSSLADGQNIPFDAFYPLGVRTPSAFPPDWFKVDQQDNPHLFVEYMAVLAVRDFAANRRDLTGVVRHVKEAAPPYGGPLVALRRTLYEAAVLQSLISTYVLPLLAKAKESKGLPGHPWIAALTAAAGVPASALVEHFTAVLRLVNEVLISAGADRTGALLRAGAAEVARARALRKNELTRESFPTEFLPQVENLDLAASLATSDPDEMFADFDFRQDGALFIRALLRWIRSSVRPPAVAPPPGQGTYHQWTQQEDTPTAAGHVLGIAVPPDDEFRSDPMQFLLRRLAAAPWRRPAGPERTAAEYPTIWAPALVHHEELLRKLVSPDRKYLHLGLLAAVLLQRAHLITPPVRLLATTELTEAFQRSLASTFPLAPGHEAMIAPQGVLVIYENRSLLQAEVPSPEDVVGFFYPDTVVVPAAGISEANREFMIALGNHAAGLGFAKLLSTNLAPNWVTTLQGCGVPNAPQRGMQFINFLKTFDDALTGEPLTLEERFETFPVPDAADWIHRLYR